MATYLTGLYNECSSDGIWSGVNIFAFIFTGSEFLRRWISFLRNTLFFETPMLLYGSKLSSLFTFGSDMFDSVILGNPSFSMSSFEILSDWALLVDLFREWHLLIICKSLLFSNSSIVLKLWCLFFISIDFFDIFRWISILVLSFFENLASDSLIQSWLLLNNKISWLIPFNISLPPLS